MKYTLTTLAVSTLAGLALAATAFGQAPGPNAGGGGFRRGGGGPGGGANWMRRLPFAAGTVSAVDPTAGTITITSQFGNQSQVIQVANTTQIVSQVDAKVSDLKAGDQVEVRGIPTSITASQLTIGQMPGMFPGGPGGRGFGGPGGGGGNPGNGGSAVATPAPVTAQASGRVFSTSPLTISLGNEIFLTLKMLPNAKITKMVPVPLSGLKVGDRIMASGQAGSNGTFAATAVAVNADMGGFGGRGFGGRGGRRNRGNFPQGGFGGGSSGAGTVQTAPNL